MLGREITPGWLLLHRHQNNSVEVCRERFSSLVRKPFSTARFWGFLLTDDPLCRCRRNVAQRVRPRTRQELKQQHTQRIDVRLGKLARNQLRTQWLRDSKIDEFDDAGGCH